MRPTIKALSVKSEEVPYLACQACEASRDLPSASPAPSRTLIGRSFSRFTKAGLLLSLPYLLLAVPLRAEVVTQQEQVVDVSPHGFTVTWVTSAPVTPGISVYSDAAGAFDVTSSLEVSPYPLKGTPQLEDPADVRQAQQVLKATLATNGIQSLRVAGTAPGKTYYYRVTSQAQDGSIVRWPPTAPAAITLPASSAFIAHPLALVAASVEPESEGCLVTARVPGMTSGTSGLLGDGAGPGEAYLNLSNLQTLEGSWPSPGIQRIEMQIACGFDTGSSQSIDIVVPDTFMVSTLLPLELGAVVNGAPVAASDTAATSEDSVVSIAVLDNDIDPDNDTLTVSDASGAQHGQLTHDGYAVVYAPAPNFYGSDAFTYTIEDGQGGSASAVVTVTVSPINDAPEAFPDLTTTLEDQSVLIDVLANDMDVDHDALSIVSVTTPAHGTATLVGNSILYNPHRYYYGSDSFSYTLSDPSGLMASAVVNIDVVLVDADDDDDDIPDLEDNCPQAVNIDQLDTDLDGEGDVCDLDDDGDEVVDGQDNCPLTFNVNQADLDSDTLGDVCDSDDDGDSVLDVNDPAPLNARICQDSDLDGCDDCSVGQLDPTNDGSDVDHDGICDIGDVETCDGQDNDGDMLVDEGFDTDDDGTADCFENSNIPGELGSVELSDGLVTQPLGPVEGSRVVLLGAPTSRDFEPGLARLQAVGADNFQAFFQEWDYLDGSHPVEDVSYLALMPGHFNLPQGVEVEVGTAEAENTANHSWTSVSFAQPFAAVPQVFATIQTNDGLEPVQAQVRNITSSGFEIGLFEEEAAMDGHALENVAFFALSTTESSTHVQIGNNTVALQLQVTGLDSTWSRLDNQALHIEEERSLDSEVTHAMETVAVLLLDDTLFAQTQGIVDSDPFVLRRDITDSDGDGLVDVLDPLPSGDNDGDGIPNAYEQSYSSIMNPNDPIDADQDPDHDRLTNLQEYTLGTFPDRSDSDSDGMTDSVDSDPKSSIHRGVEFGQMLINGSWSSVSLDSQFIKPVVIASPPSMVDPAAGVVRIRNVLTGGFEPRFQEWDNLDGVHGVEAASYSVWEARRYVDLDGTVIEAGTFTLTDSNKFKAIAFQSAFAGIPSVFVTVQSLVDPAAVTVRVKNVTASGMDAALFEQESTYTSKHTTETVGYLAIYNSTGTGNLSTPDGEMPFFTRTVTTDERPIPVLSQWLFLQEDDSKDTEFDHSDEQIAVLNVGMNTFAQSITVVGVADTVAARLYDPDATPGFEWGEIYGVGNKWTYVPLQKSFVNPVVVATAVSNATGTVYTPGVVRVSEVSSVGFALQYQPWKSTDTATVHAFYLVAEAGKGTVGGLPYEAGYLDTSLTLTKSSPWVGVPKRTFTQTFVTAPAIFSHTMSYNDTTPVTTRIKTDTTTGFYVALQEAEAENNLHLTERVGWIAVTPGTITTPSGRRLLIKSQNVSSSASSFSYGFTSTRRYATAVADINSTNELDTAVAQVKQPTTTAVSAFVQEETTLDTEVSHKAESFCALVAD